MKVFYLGCHNIFGEVNNGGIQGAKKNWELIVSNIGKENVFSAIICNEKKEIGHNVRYFKKADGNMKAVVSNLCLCRIYMPDEEKKILEYIETISPDVVYFDASIFGKIVKKIQGRYKTVVFFHNVETSYAAHRLKREGIKLLPMYISTIYNEKLAIKYADKIVGINTRDTKKIEKTYGRKVDALIPVGFHDSYCAEEVKRKKDKNLIFVGSYFGPNYDGVKWFVENVMDKLPEYNLKIIGRDFENVRNKLERRNVKVIGTVKDISQYYYNNSLIVMPIRYGEGMKVKTAEAMMYGMTIFATDEALEGYLVEKVEGIYRCNTSEDFVKNILQHYQKEFHQENAEVRKSFKENNSFEVQRNIMRSVLGL